VKIALFVDFDNVYSGLRRISMQAAERFSRQPLRWLRWLTSEIERGDLPAGRTGRRVLVRRCYLNPVTYQKYRRPFHEAGFEIVDCPPMTATGKTSTDIHLVLDTMDALLDATHFDEFVVFSADADFSPLLRRLRRHDRRTVVFAAGAMSESYKASADYVIDIQTFLRDALEIATLDEETEPVPSSEPTDGLLVTQELRARLVRFIRGKIQDSSAPVKIATLAQQLQTEFPSIKDAQWSGTGSFRGFVQRLEMDDLRFDFEADLVIGGSRPSTRATPPPVSSTKSPLEANLPLPTATPQNLPPRDLNFYSVRDAALAIVRQAVAESSSPVNLSIVGQLLRKQLPQLGADWEGSGTLAAFLDQLGIQPLRRAVLENGTTNVLYDPSRHEAPQSVVSDSLVASMLRAAELPEMRGTDLLRILTAAREHMGADKPFELSEVSRSARNTMSTQGFQISPRRVAAVLQALIFGGLDASKAYPEPRDLVMAALSVIISAWARETQTHADDDARNRLMRWLEPVTGRAGARSSS